MHPQNSGQELLPICHDPRPVYEGSIKQYLEGGIWWNVYKHQRETRSDP